MASESATSCLELAVGHRQVRVELHGRDRHLARPLVGHPEHRAVEHGRVAEQHRLDLGRRHLEPVHLDHLLRAVGQVDPALRLEPADVAGAVPAVGEGVGGGLVGQVAGHDRPAPDLDLADLPGGRTSPGVEVGDPELDAGRWQPGGVQPPLVGSSTGLAAMTGTSLAP